ncbi:Cytochrome c oxidase assembly protein COX16, mitochondrial [Beauveria bassiana]|nr:Cytochrome c oxidase assembly protein COX16, mitochondrial [Beauveria bassiana]
MLASWLHMCHNHNFADCLILFVALLAPRRRPVPRIDAPTSIKSFELPLSQPLSHHIRTMPTFQSKKFRSTGEASAMGAKYRAVMSRHPFLMFGLPFLAVIVAGSFVLTPATAIRYERHDRRVRQMTRDEELNVRRSARKVDMREEYYRLAGGKDLDNWEQKRVERLPGESDGILR